jgi:transposase
MIYAAGFLKRMNVKKGRSRNWRGALGVGFEYVRKIRRQLRRSGQLKRVPQLRHGRLSRFTDAVQEQLRVWLLEQPDLTEMELRERLAESGVQASKSRVGQVLRQMRLSRKKNSSRRRT